MAEQPSSLVTFYKLGWENHQQAVIETTASLSPEQLTLPVAAHYVSIGRLLAHMIDARISWFSAWMGEGTADLEPHHWREVDGQAVYAASELIALFEQTWLVIAAALDRWGPDDLQQLITPPASHQIWLQEQGLAEEPPHTRQWIIWHVLEHEVHHGGELSLALGTHGVADFYTW
jgi:uncharacterized damage-inducible protein DinB